MMLEFLGMILVPIIVVGIGFVYLFLAFRHEDYVQERGCNEFHRLYPDEYCPHDCSFWAIKAVERDRKREKEK